MASEAKYRSELHEKLVEEARVTFLQTAPIACGGISRVEELKTLVQDTPTRLSPEVSSTAVALIAACQSAASDDRIAHVEYHYVHTVFFDDLKLKRHEAHDLRHSFPDTPGRGMTIKDRNVRCHFELTKSSRTQELQSAVG